MLDSLTEHILMGWDGFFPNIEQPGHITYLGMLGSVEGGTTTFLGFDERKDRPLFAAKVYRDPSAQDRAMKEAEMLRFISGCDDSIASTVPKVVLCEKISNNWVVVQTILQGSTMGIRMRRSGRPDIITADFNMNIAVDWLTKLHAATRGRVTPDKEKLITSATETINEFSHTFDLSVEESRFLKEITSGLEISADDNLSIQHGDFCRQNILVKKDSFGTKIGVIDWSDAKIGESPLHDLLHFLTTYCLQARRDAGISSFIKIFEDSFFNIDSYSSLIGRCIRGYCDHSGIGLSLVEALFGMFLIDQAVSEHKKLVKHSVYGGLPGFTIYLASSNNRSFQEALKEQLWVYLFRTLAKRRRDFIISRKLYE